MEVLPGHAPVRIQPILGVSSEAFDAIDVVSADWPTLLLADRHVFASQLQCRIRLPLVCVVQCSSSRVCVDLAHDRDPIMCRDRHGLHPAIALDESEDDHLARRSPPALALSGASKGGFVTFDRTLERLPAGARPERNRRAGGGRSAPCRRRWSYCQTAVCRTVRPARMRNVLSRGFGAQNRHDARNLALRK